MCSIARGSCTGLVTVTVDPLVSLFYSLTLKKVNFVRVEKTVTEMATGCLRTMKSCYISILSDLKVFLVCNKNMRLCLYIHSPVC